MVKKATLFKVFLNSFLIQSAWSFQKMQGLGFAAALLPAIKDISRNTGESRHILKRHMAFYNAHPYMASPILGAVIRMEEEVMAGQRDEKDVVLFKESLMGPYGALGDAFFWGAIRPLASLLGIVSAVLWGLWAPLVFLILFNIFHLWMRWVGLLKGYNLGDDVVEYIKSLRLPEWALKIQGVAAGLLGILVALIIVKILEPEAMMGRDLTYSFLTAAGVSAVSIVLSGFLRKGISPTLAVYILFLPAFVFVVLTNMFFGG